MTSPSDRSRWEFDIEEVLAARVREIRLVKPLDLAYTLSGAAEVLKVSRRTLEGHVASGSVASFTVGRARRIAGVEVARIMNLADLNRDESARA